jgi:Cu/Ag efflux pump CusA
VDGWGYESISGMGLSRLFLAPGAGKELYRGLGAVVVGGLICFDDLHAHRVPLLFSLVLDCQAVLLRGSSGHFLLNSSDS